MNKIFSTILLLLICVSAFGAYTAPNEDTVVAVGGLGTQANKAQLNGGGATKAVWDAGSPSDFINTNGGPITADTGCAFTDADDNISKVGIGTGVTVGTLAYVAKTAGAGTITTGVYEITTVTDNDNIIISGHDASGDSTLTVNVGGALDGLQNTLDNGVNNAASYNRYIYTNLDETLTAAIDVDTFGGSSNTRVIVKGANSSCVVDGTRSTLTGNADVASGLLSFTSTVTNTQWWYIDFDAGGASKFDYCVYNAADQTSSISHFFHDCLFRGALDGTGVFIESSDWGIIKCQIYGNGDGLWSDGGYYIRVLDCSVHDNTGEGLKLSGSAYSIINNFIYDNGANGILSDSGLDYASIIGNTIFGNNTHGLSIAAGSDYHFIVNNTSCGNGTGGSGYGYNMADRGNTTYFGYNHSADGLGNANDNADGHCNLMTDPTSDAEFQDFLEGNNQTGNPTFTSIADGSENFTPTGGNLIDNALDAGTN